MTTKQPFSVICFRIPNMKYRADIDGLRALAVLPVVLYHAGFSAFPGGFVGVDIFFVISGYLITKIIHDEISQGRFTLIGFYERRARRILPALFAVLTFTIVGALLLLFPNDLSEFGKSVAATATFSSNILFWLDSGYFDAAADTKLLLHTWSLAVEEQFYILFPLILMLIARYAQNRLTQMLWLGVAASFALSVWGVTNMPDATFYLAPTRAWELLIGSLAAIGAISLPPQRWLRETAGIAGFFLIAGSVFFLNSQQPFPGYNALYPCFGALLIILSGQDGMKSTAGTLLSTRPIVFVGLISYSLYLWHWPLIVLLKYWSIDTLTDTQEWAIVGLSFILAWLSWRYVEKPFRGTNPVFSRKNIFKYGAAVSVLFAGLGITTNLTQGFSAIFPTELTDIVSYSSPNNPRQKECLALMSKGPDEACIYGAKDALPDTVLWGDSHADALIYTLGEHAEKNGTSLYFYGSSGCILSMGPLWSTPKRKEWCASYSNRALEIIVDSDHIKSIIFVARWTAYTQGPSSDFGPAEAEDVKMSVNERAIRERFFEEEMNRVVGELHRAGKKIVLVYPIPETGYHIPRTLAKLAMRGDDYGSFSRPFSYYEGRHDFVFNVFDNLNDNNLIARVFPHKKLCNDKSCMTSHEGKPLYFDDDHLSDPGVELIYPLLEGALIRQEN